MSVITPPRGYTEEALQRRRHWLHEKTQFNLDALAYDTQENYKGLIENHVANLTLPVAIAGPLNIDGSYAKGEYFVPLCTLEGTLVMSMTRGLYLTTLAGGISTQHIKQELSRSPIFIFKSITETKDFVAWIKTHLADIQQAAQTTTQHGKLLRIEPYIVHNRVILDFIYHTAEAAGQNMVTIATDAALRFINEKLNLAAQGVKSFIECNFNCDKNPASKTLIAGRGHKVTASVAIPNKYLKRVLRIEANELVQHSNEKSIGSQLAGVLGQNMHLANGLAAIYLATGQDVACVAENAIGIVSYETLDQGETLIAQLTMPSITVGTVGGGTRLKAQRQHLNLLGCSGPNSSRKFAEIICASALALELSLAGAVGSHEFAKAHSQYGR